MGRKINRLLRIECVFGGQHFKPSRCPVADGLLGQHGEPPLGDCSFPKQTALEVEDRTRLRQHGLTQNFILRKPQCLRGLEHEQNMAGRLRMDKFIGDLRDQRPQQVRVTFKEANVFVIRGSDERVDLYSKSAPVLEEKLDCRERQLRPDEPAHELPLGNPFVPTLKDFLVESVDEGLGFRRAHLDAELRRYAACHLLYLFYALTLW